MFLLLLQLFLVTGGWAKQVAMYWGQDMGGGELSLAQYCNDTSVDIIVISYLSDFNGLKQPKMGLKSACSSQWCTSVGGDIRECQEKGKKVLLSLGGPKGVYNIGTDETAKSLAQQLWTMFFDRSNTIQPLGEVSLDGIDLSPMNLQGMHYTEMVDEMRKFSQESKKKIIVSVSPGCKFPDTNLDDVITNGQIDMLFIRFFNDEKCDQDFNQAIQKWNQLTLEKPALKLFVGIAASRQVADSGFMPLDNIKYRLDAVRKSIKSYGGIALTDASAAFGEDGFGKELAEFVHSHAALSRPNFAVFLPLVLFFMV
ncbi:Chitinase 2 [Entomophthora muscae]|uniref:Chitinase 2 n=1 Tax=Entomophthora muscae TaxID=34485 RepID=A0ACC2SNB7_9FUNG|nr:Chitinase 2 [Entomophthora muscae]